MTLDELRAKWERRRTEHAALDSHVSAERLIGELLADVVQLVTPAGDERTHSLAEAAQLTHYHAGSLARFIKQGKLANYGTARRPRVKVSECPRKVAADRPPDPDETTAAPTPGPALVAPTRPSRASSAPTSLAHEAIAGRIGGRRPVR